MKKSLWIVVVIVAAFLGFLVGYSVPPMIEVGMIGGSVENPGAAQELSEEMQEYYADLLKEE